MCQSWILAILVYLYRTIYWSDIGSNPLKIKKASMDGSDVRAVVSLNKAINFYDYTFVFTLDYSQQILYWMNGNDDCRYTSYIESSKVDGSGRRIVHSTSQLNVCSYGPYYRTQSIDFFRGALYSYSRQGSMYRTVESSIHVVGFLNWYMCHSSDMYSHRMKVLSPERQLQGIIIINITSAN